MLKDTHVSKYSHSKGKTNNSYTAVFHIYNRQGFEYQRNDDRVLAYFSLTANRTAVVIIGIQPKTYFCDLDRIKFEIDRCIGILEDGVRVCVCVCVDRLLSRGKPYRIDSVFGILEDGVRVCVWIEVEV